MSPETEKSFEDREAELYLALEQVLEEMSQSTRPQRKLADELVTLLQHHYEQFGCLQEKPCGEVEIRIERNQGV